MVKCAHFESAAIIRGCEGGIIPSLQQPSKFFEYIHDGELEARECVPTALGIQQSDRAVPIPDDIALEKKKGDVIANKFDVNALAKCAAACGIEALQGKPGIARDSLLYIGSIVLNHLRYTETIQDAYTKLSKQLDNGSAWERFQQAII